MTFAFSTVHRFKILLTTFPQGSFLPARAGLPSSIQTFSSPALPCAPSVVSPFLTIFISILWLLTASLPALATTSSQMLIDDTVVIYDIPKGYTNAPQTVIDAIKDEFAVHAPISWVDFVAAYSPSSENAANKLSALASERLVIFLEMGLISQRFSAKDFHKLNAPAVQFIRSKDSPAQEYYVENCQLAISRPLITRNTNNQFTVSFLETFICPEQTNWTQTIVSRVRVHSKIITVHQLCTSSDYKDILTFKKHHATALANLRFR